MPLSGGRSFAGYKIIRLLGAGGMGEVYLAEHPRLPRNNALKVLPAEVSADPDYRARFAREADLASKLWHPHIVSVHDRGEYDGQLWISMDFVDGLDAGRALTERHPGGMPLEQVIRVITAMAGALDYAHKRGLLHRDVKPSNVILALYDHDDEQRILLTDFGIARTTDEISGLTATNMTMGTVAYAAPEQLMGGEIDGRADQYALAATAYHLLTGRELFPASNPAVVISRHLSSAPPSLADACPDLAALDPVLRVALAKGPADRFDRCSDFARALAEAASGQASPSTPTMAAPIPAPTVRKSSQRRRLLAMSATLVVIAGTVAAGTIWHPWSHQKPLPASATTAAPPVTSTAATVLAPAPSTAPSPPTVPPTKVITLAAVVNGQPAQGFSEIESQSNMHEVSGCDSSPAAVDFRIYSCIPTAAGANVCWPSTPGTLLCIYSPWDKGVYREYYTDPLPLNDPPPKPQPFALLLDDGTQCILRNGGAWGGRADGYYGAYGCRVGNTNILAPPQADAPVIDRSKKTWTVKTGDLGQSDKQFPPPETHTVTTAYFAGN